jgi:hypothetical protein
MQGKSIDENLLVVNKNKLGRLQGKAAAPASKEALEYNIFGCA